MIFYVSPILAPIVTAWCERAKSASRVTFAGPFETITPWKWDWFDQG